MGCANREWACLSAVPAAGAGVCGRRLRLSEVQAAHRAGGRCEFVRFQAHTLQCGHEKIWERIIAIGVEGEMLAVFEAAASENRREVRGDVCVGVAEI